MNTTMIPEGQIFSGAQMCLIVFVFCVRINCQLRKLTIKKSNQIKSILCLLLFPVHRKINIRFTLSLTNTTR